MKDIYSFFLDMFGEFTQIQKLALQEIEEGNNTLIIAPTGSGKTEAAILPILKDIQKNRTEGICVLYITPLRALNRDMMKRLSILCDAAGVSIGIRHGDTSRNEREMQVKTPPELLITTPESMQNILLSPRLRESLKNLRYVVVDEIHELYYNKRGAQLAVALERFREYSGEFIRIGISATVGNYKEAGAFLFNDKKNKIIVSNIEKKLSVKITMPTIPLRRHDEFRASFDLDDSAMARIEFLEDIIKTHNASLIFGNTRQVVETVGSRILFLGRLENLECVGIHHSSLDKEERIDIENGFKDGKIKSIIATSSLELGIDIGKIDIVVQYGSPRQSTRLLQRVGRSGHKEGLVSNGIIIVSGIFDALESAATIISAENKDIEKHFMEICPLDVLANQISAMALEYKKISVEKIFSIIKRSSSFKSLTLEQFIEVVKFMASIKTISINEGNIFTGVASRKYFINNISVIPDTPRILVRQISTNKIISTLDERFVYSSIEEGYSFITKGIPWKVIKIEEGVIFVERSEEIDAAIPDWIGEDIPVSANIAKQTISFFADFKKISGFFYDKDLVVIDSFLKKQKEFFIPELESILFEVLDDFVVFYVPLGTLANGFYARKMSSIFKKMEMDVVVKPTPYAIIVDFRFSRKRPEPEKIIDAVFRYEENIEILTDSELFRYKFIQIAKLFGIVEKHSTPTKNVVNKLIFFYKDTVVYKEAIRDVEKNYLDYETIFEFSKKYSEGKIRVKIVNSGSPISFETLKIGLGYREFLTSSNPGDEEIEGFIKRFENKDVSLLCTYCGMIFSKKIMLDQEKNDKIICIRCKSPMISTRKDEYVNVINKKYNGKKINKIEKEAYENAIKEAGLISAYSWRAIIALLTYGIGISTAGKILKMFRTTDKKFVNDILNAQRTFVKNSRFWKK